MQHPSPFRLCVDCIHYRANEATTRLNNNLDRCAAPELVKVRVGSSVMLLSCAAVNTCPATNGNGVAMRLPYPRTLVESMTPYVVSSKISS